MTGRWRPTPQPSGNALWRPTSPCGSGCLPAPGTTPQAPPIVIVGRLLATLAALAGLAAALPVLAVLPRARAAVLARAVARGLLRALGVQRRLSGVLAAGPVLLVANHISWLDALALAAVTPARVVAKREVRRWPVIGSAAAAIGTVFIDRAHPRQLPTAVRAVTAALRAGETVVVFAEGTTWCGRSGGRLRPAMFQAAIDAGVPVVPVAIAYRHADPVDGQPTTVAAFVGHQTLVASLCRVVSAAGLTATLRAGAPLPATLAGGRRHLAALATSDIAGTAVASTRPGAAVTGAGAASPHGVVTAAGVAIASPQVTADRACGGNGRPVEPSRPMAAIQCS